MKRSISALFLVFALALSLAACGGNDSGGNSQTADKETPAKDFEYADASGGIEITGYKGSAKTIVVPELIGDKKVVSIADSAFSGNVVIESVTLPDSVKNIPSSAFNNCDKLTYLKCSGVEKMGGGNSPGMNVLRLNKLVEIDMPNLTYIHFESFKYESLKSFNTPSVKTLEKYYSTNMSKSLENVIVSDTQFKYYIFTEQTVTGLYTEYPEDYRYSIEAGNTKLEEITDANRAQVYCDFFGVDSITVNGTKYTK